MGHEYEAVVSERTRSKGTGCPYCSGQKVLAGFNDVASRAPHLVPEALFDATAVNAGSQKNYPWRCELGHEWRAFPKNRVAGAGCPFCANKRAWPGFNDLATTHPEVAVEADFDSTQVMAGSAKKLPWKCSQGHAWITSPNARTNAHTGGTGCPFCSGRAVLPGFNDLGTTHPELASEAQFDVSTITAGCNQNMPWRCSSGHDWNAKPNDRKNGNGCPYCGSRAVLKGFNDLATTHPELAQQALFDPTLVSAGSNQVLPWVCAIGHQWFAEPNDRKNGNGCPYCANKKLLIGFNDLATTHPGLAAQALFDATSVIAGTNKKGRWLCDLGHEYTADINSRKQGSGCPYCAGKKVLPGFNDLATTHPQLATEALFDATRVTAGSARMGTWLCPKGHEWSCKIPARTYGGNSCHYCTNKRVLIGYNDLATTNPDLASQADGWDPTTVTKGSGKRMPWVCDKGHRWKAIVAGRNNGFGCPSCAEYGYRPDKPGWLYLLIHYELELLQIGITNVPEKRLATHAQFGWEVLDLQGPKDGDVAANLERLVKRYIRHAKLRKAPRDFPGFTESWYRCDLDVSSIPELMRVVKA